MERRAALLYRRCVMPRWMLSVVVLLILFAPARAENVKPPERYAAAVAALEKWLDEEVAAKKLPALSLALVDDQTVVWSHGFGWQDEGHMMHASADTHYRVASVSKPFTAL